MAPLPIALLLHATMGATFALAAGKALRERSFFRTPAFWALVVIQVTLVVPTTAYALWRFPAWSLMYLVTPGLFGLPDASLAVLVLAAAGGGFIVVRNLLAEGRTWVGFLLVVAGAFLAALAVSLGRAQLTVVGTTEAFRADPTTLRGIAASPLLFILPPTIVAVLVSWGMTLWRLVLWANASRDVEVAEGASRSKVASGPSAPKGAEKPVSGKPSRAPRS